MKKKSPTILVLGAGGMVGHTVFNYLRSKYPDYIYGTIKTQSSNEKIIRFNASTQTLENVTDLKKFDFIINCIGILKNEKNKNYSLNYTLPNKLEKLQKKYKFKLIHISTDDVFNPGSGSVSELSKPNPNNKYGRSKLKGETKSKYTLNIRTSFVGFDQNNHKGLIEWAIKNKEKKVQGYDDQLWSGCTTLQFAKFCEYLTGKKNFEKITNKRNIVHFSPLGPITKYELLKDISKILKLKLRIEKVNPGHIITRQLSSTIFDRKFLQRYTTETNLALLDLIKFENL